MATRGALFAAERRAHRRGASAVREGPMPDRTILPVGVSIAGVLGRSGLWAAAAGAAKVLLFAVLAPFFAAPRVRAAQGRSPR